jgi:UPF0755 protein
VSELLDLRDEHPSPRRRRRRSPLVKVLAVLVFLLLVVGLAVGAVVVARALLPSSGPADYEGEGTGEAVVAIEPGDTAGDVADTLAEQDVVASRSAFFQVAVADERSRGLQPGSYRVRQQMSAAAALELLLDPAARLVDRVTVPEGFTVEQTLERLAESTPLELDDLEAAAAEPAEGLGLPDYAEGRLEGFLFPATYEVQPGTTAEQLLGSMVARFNQAAQALDLEAGAQRLGRTPYEIVIVGSLIEREVRFDDEYPRVAQVVYNRLERGERVDIDAAVLYGLGRTSGTLTRSDLESDSPYNLRRVQGLPPTPISSPGEATLRGALNPSGGDEMFYVLATREGRSTFTETLAEHNRAVARARAEGIF